MPPPQVRYAAPTQQPEVQVQPSQPQVVVTPTQPTQPNVQQAGAPSVQYQQVGEPRVVYQQEQGQPVIRFEQIGQHGGAQGSQQTQPTQTQSGTGATGLGTGTAGVAGLTASQVVSYDLYGADGRQIGDVERVVAGSDNRQYLVVGAGGFLGLGERKVLVPIEQVRLAGDRLVAQQMTEAQVKQLQEYRASQGTWREISGDQTVSLSR
jgi:sporulation protein YlmC with PRC-barrel domain